MQQGYTSNYILSKRLIKVQTCMFEIWNSSSPILGNKFCNLYVLYNNAEF